MAPLRAAVDCDWVEVDLARINPVGGNKGCMDGTPEEVASCLQAMHKQGKGDRLRKAGADRPDPAARGDSATRMSRAGTSRKGAKAQRVACSFVSSLRLGAFA
jgi:hypothetical protein